MKTWPVRRLKGVDDFQRVAGEVREATGGIPIGVKMSAQHIENDIDFALAIGVDYIIIDGRGGGTGAAPNVLKNNISVPTMAAIGRGRKHSHLSQFDSDDLTSWKKEVADLAGIRYAGMSSK